MTDVARGTSVDRSPDGARVAASRLTPAVTLRAVDADEIGRAGGAVGVSTHGLEATYGTTVAVRDATLAFAPGRVTAIIGPSGCGKSTFLRCLNRLHETVPAARVRGDVRVGGASIYASGVDAIGVRRGIGFVAQRPTPFPTMSVRDNVVAGLRVAGIRARGSELDDRVEQVLQRTGLWTEVADRLDDDPMALSGGQQQRLCLARALAPAPRVLLLDEPTAALDPGSTQRIEELVYSLRGDVTVVIVTHNMQQAARVSDHTAFLLAGELVEVSPTRLLFTTPVDRRTEAYVTGRFG
jgi:phosphate transport system ATP-binding protein